MKEKVLAILTSIVMVTAMAPVFSFATEGDENGVTETPDMTQPFETEEPATQEVTEEAAEPAETDETEPEGEPEEAQEPEATFEAKADNVVLPDHPGAARVENTGQYRKSMRIYGIYLKRKSGSTNSDDEYGDAVLIESNGKFLLMDCGSNSLGGAKGSHPSNLVQVLKDIGVKELDVYISHFHGDHHGGLVDVCNAFKVNKIYFPHIELCKEYISPGGKKIQTIYNEQTEVANDANNGEGAELVYLAPSNRGIANTYSYFTVGAVQCSVIGPNVGYRSSQFSRPLDYLNNCSLVTILSCGGFRLMSAGDAATKEEADLASKYGSSLNCDMMKLNHHGIGTSNTTAFLRCVTPMWSFAENHGFSKPGGISRSQDYGYNYRVASNKHTFIADINNGLTRIFIDSNNNSRPDERPMTGWVAVKTHYQFYDGYGYIKRGWSDISGNKYYLDWSSGFRLTGTYKFNKVKCKFDKNGKLTDPKKPAKTKTTSIKAKKKKHKVIIRWKKAKRASAYQVYRATSKGGPYVLVSTRSKKARSYTNRNLTKGKTYYYKVRAIRYVAGTTLYGPCSKVKKIKAK